MAERRPAQRGGAAQQGKRRRRSRVFLPFETKTPRDFWPLSFFKQAETLNIVSPHCFARSFVLLFTPPLSRQFISPSSFPVNCFFFFLSMFFSFYTKGQPGPDWGGGGCLHALQQHISEVGRQPTLVPERLLFQRGKNECWREQGESTSKPGFY